MICRWYGDYTLHNRLVVSTSRVVLGGSRYGLRNFCSVVRSGYRSRIMHNAGPVICPFNVPYISWLWFQRPLGRIVSSELSQRGLEANERACLPTVTTGDRISGPLDFLHRFKITRCRTRTISIAYVRAHSRKKRQDSLLSLPTSRIATRR